MPPLTFPEIRINADDLARLESAVGVEHWQKALHEHMQKILDQGNVIASQERELREMREKLRGLYEERDRLQQRVSENEEENYPSVDFVREVYDHHITNHSAKFCNCDNYVCREVSKYYGK